MNYKYVWISLVFLIPLASAGWLEGWEYRKPLEISTSSELTNYQLNLTIEHETGKLTRSIPPVSE